MVVSSNPNNVSTRNIILIPYETIIINITLFCDSTDSITDVICYYKFMYIL